MLIEIVTVIYQLYGYPTPGPDTSHVFHILLSNSSKMTSSPYNSSPGHSTAYHSAGSCAPTVRSLRMLILFYSALRLSFIKLLFHLHVLLFDE